MPLTWEPVGTWHVLTTTPASVWGQLRWDPASGPGPAAAAQAGGDRMCFDSVLFGSGRRYLTPQGPAEPPKEPKDWLLDAILPIGR